MNIPYAVGVEKYDDALQRLAAAKATLAVWQEAFGLLTTLAPDLGIDITDPLGMARAIERHVLAERAALAAANARADEAKMAEWIVADACPLCSSTYTRVSYDDANDVRISYCLHCKAAILWAEGCNHK